MNKQIIKIIQKLQNGIYFGLGLTLTIGIVSLAYAAISYSSLGGQTSGGNLSAAMWNKLYEHTVPVGFVGSFDLATCPTGWTEYTPARGRFIRGIDSTGTNDSVRVAGNTQADDFKTHNHKLTNSNNLGYMYDNFTNVNGFGVVNGGRVSISRAKNYNTLDTGSTETRPKNVALLFCRKD